MISFGDGSLCFWLILTFDRTNTDLSVDQTKTADAIKPIKALRTQQKDF